MCITFAVSVIALAIYNKGISDVIISQYGQRSIDITSLVAAEIDTERLENVRDAVLDIYNTTDNKVMSDKWGTPEFEEYISRFSDVEETDDYKAVLSGLRRLQDKVSVDCLYIIWIDTENECYVYLVDAAYEEPCPIGCIDPLYVDNVEETLNNLSNGMAPNITNTPEYGWLISTCMPIYDNEGEIMAFSVVDISMNEVVASQTRFMIYTGLAFLAVIILICATVIFLINRFIVKPINKLSRAASQYKENPSAFSELDIKRRDEIGMLADSMVRMEREISSYISELKTAQERAEEMDRAANIDALTKVRNKRAYDVEAERLDESSNPYGLVLIDMNDLKVINDTYGHDKGDIGIKTVCRIICRVFKHSLIFRVGGDEFVVILEGNDYKERAVLMSEIAQAFADNKADSTLQPWERVTAAVGCAFSDSEKGESAESVFQRADAAMYENKKAMKVNS